MAGARARKPHERTKAQRRVLSPDEAWADRIEETIIAGAIAPYQVDVILDEAKRYSMLTGRGATKTSAFRARGVRTLTRKPNAIVLYFAVTRSHAERLMWLPLKEMLDKLRVKASFGESKLACTIERTGSVYQLAGADDRREIEKWRGLSFDEVQIDEAASFTHHLLSVLIYEIVGPRLGDRGGCIGLGGTPGRHLEGLFYDVTRPSSPKHRPYVDRGLPEYDGWKGWSSHAWNLAMIADLPDAEDLYPKPMGLWREALERKAAEQWSVDNPIWLREYMGRWAADNTGNVFQYRVHDDAGAPWNQWDPPRPPPLQFATPPSEIKDWHYSVAMDAGYKDPFACNVFAFSPQDPQRRIFHVFGFERTAMHARSIAEMLIGKDEVQAILSGRVGGKLGGLLGITGWPDAMIMDADEALLAELSNVYGIRIAKAEKNANYKAGAIELVNGDLVDGRIKILKGSELEQQLLTLQWKVDEETRQMREDKAQANHSTDCLVYGRRALAQLFAADAQPTKSGAGDAPTQARADPRVPHEYQQPESRGEYAALLGDSDFGDTWGNQ